MSLVGYRAQNHAQQTAKRGPLDVVDDRGTDPALFALLDGDYGPFTLDVAAAPHNAKCERYFTLQDDGLAQSWAGERVWCNPPYSNLADWCAKAWQEAPGTLGIVMLVPANRCEQRWWQEHVEPYRDSLWTGQKCRMCAGTGVTPWRPQDGQLYYVRDPACNGHGREPGPRDGQLTVRFLPGRPRFVKPAADSIGPNERPPFGCALLIWRGGAA